MDLAGKAAQLVHPDEAGARCGQLLVGRKRIHSRTVLARRSGRLRPTPAPFAAFPGASAPIATKPTWPAVLLTPSCGRATWRNAVSPSILGWTMGIAMRI